MHLLSQSIMQSIRSSVRRRSPDRAFLVSLDFKTCSATGEPQAIASTINSFADGGGTRKTWHINELLLLVAISQKMFDGPVIIACYTACFRSELFTHYEWYIEMRL